ncbi:MAG: PSD1 and planctomycete cytochrome C domain-containing protein [Limisphaerales bacterium]
MLPRILGGLLLGAPLLLASGTESTTRAFELLRSRCLECHGASRSENGLRLDVQAPALQGGDHGPALVPGKPDGSLILQVVGGTHPDLPVMPRRGERLRPDEIGILRQWITEGAPWPETSSAAAGEPVRKHWAFEPIRRGQIPGSSSRTHPIDAFVRDRLRRERLKSAPRADAATLIRRLSLDLTGLPPTPEEVDAFVASPTPKAYAAAVERLLTSPHYGEKWARHWLDAARYADSNGFEKDRTRSIWPYRDWVIEALNRDLPFDEFTRHQIAGDLLADRDPALGDEQAVAMRVATGFLRNSMVNMEGGVEPEKFRVETIIDRVDAVGRTWLGLTIACAQCHNHKYDPITQQEYYQFYDFLNQDVEPRLDLPTKSTAERRREIRNAAAALETKLLSDPAIRRSFEDWERRIREATQVSWTPLDVFEWHSTPMKYEKQEDFSFVGGGDVFNSAVLRFWVDTQATNLTGFRLEAMNHGNLPNQGPGLDGNGDFLIGEFFVEATPLSELRLAEGGGGTPTPSTNRVAFRRVLADFEEPGFPASALLDGVTTSGGWTSALNAGRRNEERRAIFEVERAVGFPGGTRLLITVHAKLTDDLQGRHDRVSNFIPGRLRLSATSDSGTLTVDPLSESQRRRLLVPNRTEEQTRELFRVYLFQDSSLEDSARRWEALWKDWPASENTTLVLQRREPSRQTRIFRRGDWQKPTLPVSAGVPSVLNGFPAGQPRDRVGLAEWLVDPANPLTARVVVNRVWQSYFGQGLVTTPEDFGVRSDPPSHPELLDWLASEWVTPTRRNGPSRPWSFKDLHRWIVSSETYQQSSRISPEALERDPGNRLLARGPRFRVDAETVQDIALKASGLLSGKVGGPSVFPPIPDGVMALAYGPIPWNVSEGDDRFRRAMYTFWKRSAPYPALMAFDAPPADQSCVRRIRSNTPLQALVTLNDPTFHQAARWLGWRAVSQAGNDTTRLDWLFRRCASRRPTAEERAILMRLLSEARLEFAGRPGEAAAFALSDPKSPPPLPEGSGVGDLAAWTAVGRAVLNLDEVVTKE